jgi:VRR-NUC domain
VRYPDDQYTVHDYVIWRVEGRKVVEFNASVDELPYQNFMVQLCQLNGMSVAHFATSRNGKNSRTETRYDATGYPDLTIMHGQAKCLWVECKAWNGRLQPDQRAWMEMCQPNWQLWSPRPQHTKQALEFIYKTDQIEAWSPVSIIGRKHV